MDIQRAPKKKNIAIVASADGTPVEQQSGKRLSAPQADIVGGVEDPVVAKEELVATPEVVVTPGPECYFCKSKDLVITDTRILCNTCLKSEWK